MPPKDRRNKNWYIGEKPYRASDATGEGGVTFNTTPDADRVIPTDEMQSYVENKIYAIEKEMQSGKLSKEQYEELYNKLKSLNYGVVL